MKITVNGKPREVDEGITLIQLLEQLKLSVGHLAIEHNKNFLTANDIPEVQLSSGDTLEIVHFVGGG